MNRRAAGLWASSIVFIALFIDSIGAYRLAAWDTRILKSLQGMRSDPVNAVMLWLTNLSGHIAVPVFGFGLLIFLALRKEWNNLFFSFSALIGSLLLFTACKEWVGRVRPETMLYDPGHYAFPSGHAAMSTIMALLIYFIFKSSVSKQRQTRFLIVCMIFPMLISFTRIFLHVHYPSDVIAGVAISMCWIILLSNIYHAK